MTPDSDLIRRCEELCEKASPAPWKADQVVHVSTRHGEIVVACEPPSRLVRSTAAWPANAQFIAFSREAVPALLTALREATDRAAKAEAERDEWETRAVERDREAQRRFESEHAAIARAQRAESALREADKLAEMLVKQRRASGYVITDIRELDNILERFLGHRAGVMAAEDEVGGNISEPKGAAYRSIRGEP